MPVGRTTRWSLYIDESGKFDDPDDPVTVAGLAIRDDLPGGSQAEIRKALELAAPEFPWPLHASLLNQSAYVALAWERWRPTPSFDEQVEAKRTRARNAATEAVACPYVDLAMARGDVQMGLRDPREPGAATLHRLSLDAGSPPHVRWSAARWLIAALWGIEGEDARRSAAATREALEAAAASDSVPDSDAAMKSLALIAIDGALPRGDAGQAARALGTLRDLEPGLIRHLVEAAPSGSEAAYVARFYPY